MNAVINTTVTSAFLNDLTRDRSRIKEIAPAVIFKRVLGVGENLDRAGVIKALQRQASNAHALEEYHRNLTNPRFVGEMISFDIGPSPTWMRFSVVREPLPKPKKGYIINFVVTVTDRQVGKRWTRLIGAIANEANENGDMTPVFRTISDMCEEEDIVTAVDQNNLVDLKKEPPKEEPPKVDEKPVPDPEPKKEEGPQDGDIIISINQKVEFIKTSGQTAVIADENGKIIWEDDIYTTGIDALSGVQGTAIKFVAANNVSRIFLKTCSPKDIISEFVAEKNADNQNETADEAAVSAEEEKKEEVPEIPEPATEEKKEETTQETADVPPPPPPETDSVGEVSPSPAIADIDASQAKQEPVAPTREKLFEKDEVTEFEDEKGVDYAAKDDIYDDQWNACKNIEERKALFYKKPAEKVEQPEPVTTNEETKNMEEQLWAHKGDIREIDGKKYVVKCDISLETVKACNGVIDEYVELVVDDNVEASGEETNVETQNGAENKDIKPIGDIPENKSIYEDISAVEHCNMLFGTTNPNIMHLLNFLKKECTDESYKGEEYTLTGTFPVELMSVWPKYTYSIVRMKNGAFYRIFVCFTDMSRNDSQSWVKTHAEQGRWMRVCDIQDRDVGGLFNRRRV